MKSFIFSREMVPKVLNGSKTMTRRVIKPQPNYFNTFKEPLDGGELRNWPCTVKGDSFKCPFKVGDRVYVRETHYRYGYWQKNGTTKTGRQKWRFKALTELVKYFDNPPGAIEKEKIEGWHKRSPLFMPQRAARGILEITDIWAERVRSIKNKDIKAEGIVSTGSMCNGHVHTLREHFWSLWDSLHGLGAWERNDRVWVYTFRRVV